MIPEEFDHNFMAYKRDAIEFIGLLQPESVQLIYTDPPMLGNPAEEKTYTHMEAVELCAAMADAATRALTPDGVLVISLANENMDGVLAAVVKRTHLQFGGFTWALHDMESTHISFHKGEPRMNAYDQDDSEIDLITSFILTHTDPGDTVVDPFCGNGDVMEAAVTLDRIAIMNDQDEAAIELTILRYKELSAD